MTFCRHASHRQITHIKDPKYSTNEILIDVGKVKPEIEHYLIKFASPGAAKDYGWFYMSGKVIRRAKTQKNGRIDVYAVSMDKREEFVPIKQCEHAD